MIVVQRIGGYQYTATVGRHAGSDNKQGTIRVEGPGLNQPAEYTRMGTALIGSEKEGDDAIRYTVDNIVFPKAMDALLLGTGGRS